MSLKYFIIRDEKKSCYTWGSRKGMQLSTPDQSLAFILFTSATAIPPTPPTRKTLRGGYTSN